MSSDPLAIYPQCQEGRCFAQHQVSGTTPCINGTHVKQVQDLSNLMLHIQNIVSNSNKAKSLKYPRYELDNPTIRGIYEDHQQKMSEANSDEEQAQVIRSTMERLNDAQQKLPILPSNIDWHGGYRRTIVTPHREPKMPTLMKRKLQDALQQATGLGDPEMQGMVQEALKSKRTIPWGADLRGEKVQKRKEIRQVRRQIRKVRDKSPEQAADLEKNLVGLQREYDSTDWGARRHISDPKHIEFEDKRAMLGHCSDTENSTADLWFEDSSSQDKTRRPHLEGTATTVCRGCPIEEECNNYQLVNEDTARGPIANLGTRLRVRKAIKGALDSSSPAHPVDTTALFDPHQVQKTLTEPAPIVGKEPPVTESLFGPRG